MTLKIQADTFARDNAPAFLGKNIRKYKWSSFTGEVAHNSLGGVSFGADAQGKVVEQKEGWTLVKLSASTFKVLRTELLSQEVAIGDTIDMKFYKLRRFDGSPADGSDDPAVDGCRSFMLTGAKTKFPVAGEDRYLEHSFPRGIELPVVSNPYLLDMLRQMEETAVNNGMRRTINVLVDAGAKNLAFIDPPEEDSCRIAPGISMDISSTKFKGQLIVKYDRGADTYVVELTDYQFGETQTITDVHFPELGSVLLDAIDDGRWLKPTITITKAAAKPKKAALPAFV